MRAISDDIHENNANESRMLQKDNFYLSSGCPLLFQFGMTTCVYSESGFTCGHISDPPILFIGSSLFFDK